jgi:site-specific recombinase XerD
MPQVGRFLFDNGNSEPLYQPNRFLKKLKKISKRAGVKEVNLHTLRHTFASHLIMKGVDPRTVQEYLGHSSIQVTEKYSHLSKGHKFQAIQVLNFNNQDGTKLTQIGRAEM